MRTHLAFRWATLHRGDGIRADRLYAAPQDQGRQATSGADRRICRRDQLTGWLRGRGVFPPAFQVVHWIDTERLPQAFPAPAFVRSRGKQNADFGSQAVVETVSNLPGACHHFVGIRLISHWSRIILSSDLSLFGCREPGSSAVR